MAADKISGTLRTAIRVVNSPLENYLVTEDARYTKPPKIITWHRHSCLCCLETENVQAIGALTCHGFMFFPLICKSNPSGSFTWKLSSVSGRGASPRRFNS